MAKLVAVAGIFILFAAACLSFPSIEDVKSNKNQVVEEFPKQAMIAMSPDGQPEYVVLGEEVGRSGFNNLFNFSAYLEGRPVNQTAITYVPLITILTSLRGNNNNNG